MKLEITKVEFKPFEMILKVQSEDELRELYEIVGDLSCEHGSGIIYDKLSQMLEEFGFDWGHKVPLKKSDIVQAAQKWFNETEVCDQKDGFIAGATWRMKRLKLKTS